MPTAETRIPSNHQNGDQPAPIVEGIVVPAEDVDSVEQRFRAFRAELQPSGLLGLTLVRRAAVLAIRMEKCAERDLAATADRVVQAMADVEVPDGIDPTELIRRQAEAGRLAAFDCSREACMARRYEAAAERGFFKALKELRLVEKHAKSIEPARRADPYHDELGSFLEMTNLDEDFDAGFPELGSGLNNRIDPALFDRLETPGRRVDVPITIGRGR